MLQKVALNSVKDDALKRNRVSEGSSEDMTTSPVEYWSRIPLCKTVHINTAAYVLLVRAPVPQRLWDVD